MEGGVKRDLVQVRNPKTDRYVLIDRAHGKILRQKRTAGPYEDIPIAVKRTPLAHSTPADEREGEALVLGR